MHSVCDWEGVHGGDKSCWMETIFCKSFTLCMYVTTDQMQNLQNCLPTQYKNLEGEGASNMQITAAESPFAGLFEDEEILHCLL